MYRVCTVPVLNWNQRNDRNVDLGRETLHSHPCHLYFVECTKEDVRELTRPSFLLVCVFVGSTSTPVTPRVSPSRGPNR